VVKNKDIGEFIVATFRKHRAKWQAIIRKKGHPCIAKSFVKKTDAQAWATRIEHEIDQGEIPVTYKELEKHTFKDLIERYKKEISSKKLGHHVETYIFRNILRTKIIELRLSHLSSKHFCDYRDERLKVVKASTICKELSLYQHVFEIAQKEWNLPMKVNPLSKVRKPKFNNRRDRRIAEKELKALLYASDSCRNKYIKPILLIALETGMRRGEILKAQWKHYNSAKQTLHLPETKNGHSRTIPLTNKAIEIINTLPQDNDLIFPISIASFRKAWERIRKRSNISNVRFHDFRHEAISRLFEKGLSIPEVALISGHKDMRMLFRYTHLKAEQLVEKLNGT